MGDDLPLSDLRVLDLTIARAGPTCVRQLADWGADVVKVEPPGGGPASVDGARNGSDFQNLHRNKRSMCIDLKSAEGKELFDELVVKADVLVENMRPEVKYRLGVNYERLCEINPRLVYGSISGFGQEGPYAKRGGVDQIAQGMGGIMSVTGLKGQGPVRAGVAIADLAAGMYLAIGILTALHERDRTGRGRWVRTSLLEAMIAMLDFQATRWTVDGEVPAQEGNDHPTSIPTGCFPTSDGNINVAAAGGRLWSSFCEVIERPDLTADTRFDTRPKRSANRDALNEIIVECLARKTTAEWVAAFNEAGVPAGPVNSIDQTFADPQVQYLKMVEPVVHSELGELSLIRNAVTMSGVSNAIRRTSPALGENTTEVLLDHGLDQEVIDQLRQLGIV